MFNWIKDLFVSKPAPVTGWSFPTQEAANISTAPSIVQEPVVATPKKKAPASKKPTAPKKRGRKPKKV
jgi:hypothetical protein